MEVDEPKAELTGTTTWTFRVYNRDALLIMKALGDRLSTVEEVKEARELGDRLTALRIKHLEQSAETATRLREHLEGATGSTVDAILRRA
jgi:hypothetical protein